MELSAPSSSPFSPGGFFGVGRRRLISGIGTKSWPPRGSFEWRTARYHSCSLSSSHNGRQNTMGPARPRSTRLTTTPTRAPTPLHHRLSTTRGIPTPTPNHPTHQYPRPLTTPTLPTARALTLTSPPPRLRRWMDWPTRRSLPIETEEPGHRRATPLRCLHCRLARNLRWNGRAELKVQEFHRVALSYS